MKRKKDPRAKEKEERRDMSPVLKERLKKVIPLLTDKQKYMKKTTMIQDGKTKVGQVLMRNKKQGKSQVLAQSGQ